MLRLYIKLSGLDKEKAEAVNYLCIHRIRFKDFWRPNETDPILIEGYELVTRKDESDPFLRIIEITDMEIVDPENVIPNTYLDKKALVHIVSVSGRPDIIFERDNILPDGLIMTISKIEYSNPKEDDIDKNMLSVDYDLDKKFDAVEGSAEYPVILRNMAQCRVCGDIIESKYTHDFKTCSCGAVSVDGGHEYLRRLGYYGNWLEMSVCK